MMTDPTSEHREQAREIVRAWLLTSNPHHLVSHKQRLIERISTALSVRDTEIREVLEGLRNNHGCWCPGSEDYEFKAPFVCGSDCERARNLYAKLQPGKEGKDSLILE